jgi:hypothetical protein
MTMVQRLAEALPDLYEADETAWLDAMAELIVRGRLKELDYPHLREFLSDMARRDRKEVKSRLTLLLAHLLKWEYQPRKRTASWRGTIVIQRQELRDDASTGVLRNHAEAVLGRSYQDAIEQAAAETGLPAAKFPVTCPYTIDELFRADLP